MAYSDIEQQLNMMLRFNPNALNTQLGKHYLGQLPVARQGKFKSALGASGTAGAGGGISPTPGTIPGAVPLPGYTEESGGVPGTTSPSQSLANLIAGLAGQTGNIGKLVGDLTSASTKALRDEYPAEYFNTLGTLMGNVGERARGNVSDLLPELGQGAAEWGVGAGVPGSPAFETKLARDLGLTRYRVEREALDDLGRIKAGIPTTAPFDINRLVPDVNLQSALEQIANMYAAAPKPEAAFKRNLELALAGLKGGFSGAGGGGVTRYGNAPGPSTNWPTLSAAPTPVNIALGPGRPDAVDIARSRKGSPTGWGQSWGTGGDYAQAGPVPIEYQPGNFPQPLPYNWMERMYPSQPPMNASDEDWLDWLAEDEDIWGVPAPPPEDVLQGIPALMQYPP